MQAISVTPLLRGLKLTLASCWAAGLVLVGLWLWAVHPAAAGGAIAAGQCVLMWLIADDLFPRANREVTGFLKFTAALIFWGHLFTAVYLLWLW